MMVGDRQDAIAIQALEADYQIIRELGRGGMAVVYLARDRATRAEIAIKLVRAKYVEDEEALARFAREADLLARLQHPRIVTIHAIRQLEDNSLAIIMEMVPGRTLKEVIRRRGPLSYDRATTVLCDIAEALAYAHGKGVVHRDVKPENIFLDESTGRALLSDFGVARTMDNDTSLTVTGVAIGTPSYMSPEQIDGTSLDGRSDIYSLGLVGWEMLTGRKPWDGESLYSVIYRQKNDRLPSLELLHPGIPESLLTGIEVAIEKDPNARWASAEALIDQLSVSHAMRPRRRDGTSGATETISFVRPLEEVAVPRRRWLGPMIGTAMLLGLGVIWGSSPSLRARFAESRLAPPAERIDSIPDNPASQGLDTNTIIGGAPLAGSGTRAAGDTDVTIAQPGIDSVPLAATALPHADEGHRVAIVPAPKKPAADSVASAKAKAVTPPPVAKVAAAPPGPSTPATVTVAPTLPAAPPRETIGMRVADHALIAGGGVHTCLVGPDGSPYCWGGNDQGQLGNGNSIRAATPARVLGELKVSMIAPGMSHTCAVARSGDGWCWGGNEHGQLGDGTLVRRIAPVQVTGGHSFRAIWSGASHSCGITRAGDAFCWGANTHGQLGTGDQTDATAPQRVGGGVRFAIIAPGWGHTCALTAAGTAYCWGENAAGEIGDGSSSDRSTPVQVAGGHRFVDVAAGSSHSCGVTDVGEVYCWGRNAAGQLGDGTMSDRATPTKIVRDDTFIAVAAGGVHSCAVTRSGATYCWGRNAYGQLGDGTNNDSPTPVLVAGGHAFTSIQAVGAHSCATTASGESFCWGYNVEGQLGDGTRAQRSKPIYIEKPTS